MNKTPDKPNSTTKRKSQKPPVSSPLSEIGKIPPQAVELEEAVLGALMLEQSALTAVIDILRPELFYKEEHQRIFTAINRLFAKSQPIDILTVTNELRSMGELESVGGAYYITQLTNRVASAANIEYHARIIQQKYIQRELIGISSEIIRDAFEDTSDVFDMLDTAESKLFRISETQLRHQSQNINQIINEAIQQIQNASQHEGHLIGVGSGFTELDRMTAGWQNSDLIIMAARPGMGKTAFVLTMARNMAVELDKKVAIFSLEMSAVQLVMRLISSESEISAEKLKKGDLYDWEWEKLNKKIDRLIDREIIIDDSPALSIFDLRAKCRRLKQQKNIDVVIIDYLQLMSGSGDNKGNRELEIATISRSLKALAKELNIPVICLSQLNRSVEQRTGSKRPQLSDLRESGAIEQDADMVLFIYRPEYYQIMQTEDGQSTQGMAEIIIAKHRNGPLGTIKLQFVSQFAKFLDWSGPLEMEHGISDDDYMRGPARVKTIPSAMNDDIGPLQIGDDEQPF